MARSRRATRRRDCRSAATKPSATEPGALLAHEALAGGGDECDSLGEEDAHRVAERDGLLVHAARGLELAQRGCRQLDGGVERQRGELLPRRLVHALRLLLGEL